MLFNEHQRKVLSYCFILSLCMILSSFLRGYVYYEPNSKYHTAFTEVFEYFKISPISPTFKNILSIFVNFLFFVPLFIIEPIIEKNVKKIIVFGLLGLLNVVFITYFISNGSPSAVSTNSWASYIAIYLLGFPSFALVRGLMEKDIYKAVYGYIFANLTRLMIVILFYGFEFTANFIPYHLRSTHWLVSSLLQSIAFGYISYILLFISICVKIK
jgi:hypothetical protein